MAYNKIWPIKSNMGYTIDYAENKYKTTISIADSKLIDINDVIQYATKNDKTYNHNECKTYVTGINCCKDTAFEEMMITKKAFGKMDKILAFHSIQSFQPGEINPDEAHEIGVKLAQKMWGDRFQVVVTTHLDRNHIHNHFVINSVSFLDGYKFYSNKENYARQKRISDELCLEYGKKIITTENNGIPRGAYRAEENGRYSLQSIVKKDVDNYIKMSNNLSDFFRLMKEAGYRIDTSGKYLRIYPYGHSRCIRLDRRFEGYNLDGIADMIYANRNKEKKHQVKKGYCKKVNYPAYSFKGYQAKYVKMLYIMGQMPKKPYKVIHFVYKEELIKVGTYRNEMSFLIKHNIKTADDLTNYKKKVKAEFNELTMERNKLRNKLRRASTEIREELVSKIHEKNEQIKMLKKELYYCDDVLERSSNYDRKEEMLNNRERSDIVYDRSK